MKKIGLVLVVLAVVFGVCFVANADEMSLKGKMGFGYTNAGTPLGVKMWMSDGFGFDAAVGFNSSTTQVFGIQVGADMVMANKYPVLLEFRPAVGLDVGGATNLSVPLMLNIEYFVTKNFSLTVGTGILFQITPAVVVSHCVTTTSNMGVMYYF